jgi:hypothetical protein
MKQNPNPDIAEQDQAFKGDNYVKMTGDYMALIQNEGFMNDFNKKAEESGAAINSLAMPS